MVGLIEVFAPYGALAQNFSDSHESLYCYNVASFKSLLYADSDRDQHPDPSEVILFPFPLQEKESLEQKVEPKTR